jgi:hypothetical protein
MYGHMVERHTVLDGFLFVYIVEKLSILHARATLGNTLKGAKIRPPPSETSLGTVASSPAYRTEGGSGGLFLCRNRRSKKWRPL